MLEVSPEWKTNKSEAQYTWLEYDFRVTCDPHYYGAGCANLCRPRDDPFGHYTCSDGGEIICLTGWQGDYCDKGKKIIIFSIEIWIKLKQLKIGINIKVFRRCQNTETKIKKIYEK